METSHRKGPQRIREVGQTPLFEIQEGRTDTSSREAWSPEDRDSDRGEGRCQVRTYKVQGRSLSPRPCSQKVLWHRHEPYAGVPGDEGRELAVQQGRKARQEELGQVGEGVLERALACRLAPDEGPEVEGDVADSIRGRRLSKDNVSWCLRAHHVPPLGRCAEGGHREARQARIDP